MSFGLDFGSFTNRRYEQIEEVEKIFYSIYTIVATHNSSSKCNLFWGPSFSFSLKGKYKFLSISNTFKQSFLIKNTESFGSFLISRKSEWLGETFERMQTNSFDTEKRDFSPITEANFSITYKLNKRISFSLAFIADIIWNTELAPDLIFDKIYYEISTWTHPKSSLYLYRISLGVNVHIP